MQSGQRVDRRLARHEQTVEQILGAAWRLAEQHGLAGLSVGDLARAVEMRPQSLYTYFPAKMAIYDRMYRQGFTAMRQRWDELSARHPGLDATDPLQFLELVAAEFVDFAAESPSRYQLLFQRTVPGFEPSTESYAVAVEALERMRGWLHRAGITAEGDLDLWRVLLLGLAGEQLANDPGGHRWRDLAAESARYFVAFTRSRNGDH